MFIIANVYAINMYCICVVLYMYSCIAVMQRDGERDASLLMFIAYLPYMAVLHGNDIIELCHVKIGLRPCSVHSMVDGSRQSFKISSDTTEGCADG